MSLHTAFDSDHLACAKRRFTKFKVIKNYLRNKISQNKLSGLSMISIENSLSDTINFGEIINKFAPVKSEMF